MRNKRVILIFIIAIVLFGGFFFANENLKKSLSFFYNVTDAITGEKGNNRVMRIGGLVKHSDMVPVNGCKWFVLADLNNEIQVKYCGGLDLPPMFAIGKGAIVKGRFDESGTFVAERIFAKHDESYRPPKAGETVLLK